VVAVLTALVIAGSAVACSPAGGSSTPGTSAAPGVPSAATSAGPGSPAPSADTVRIPLTGVAPGAIVLDGDRAWVLAGESGDLIEVDLAGARELRSIHVGFGPTHLSLPDPGVAAVGRFDNSENGWYLVLVDLATGELDGVTTGALGALAGGEDGVVWALEKADRLLKVDARSGAVIDDVPVDVGENVHLEVQWGAGSAWVGSDATPMLRVSGEDPAIEATIRVPTGIPFLFEGGLVWGAGPTELWALDPSTDAVTRHVPLDDVIEILGLDIEGDEAWLAVRRTGRVGAVLRLDLASGALVAEHPVSLPAAVRIGPDRAWVASYLTNELIGFAR